MAFELKGKESATGQKLIIRQEVEKSSTVA
jgi:hypothetical protein